MTGKGGRIASQLASQHSNRASHQLNRYRQGLREHRRSILTFSLFSFFYWSAFDSLPSNWKGRMGTLFLLLFALGLEIRPASRFGRSIDTVGVFARVADLGQRALSGSLFSA